MFVLIFQNVTVPETDFFICDDDHTALATTLDLTDFYGILERHHKQQNPIKLRIFGRVEIT